jgi:hypothetical protein
MDLPVHKMLDDSLVAEFNDNGFLIVESYLDSEEVDRFIEVVDRLDRTEPFSTHGVPRQPGGPMELRNTLSRAPEFLELIDRPDVLRFVAQLMGYNIQIGNSQCFIKPGFPAGTSLKEQRSFGWHTDSQRLHGAINGALPRFSTRTGYFFTGLLEENMGSVKLVPGVVGLPS